MEHFGKLMVIMGLFIMIAGLIVWFWGNKLSWFGHLPGDIRIEKEGVKFYAPLVSMLLVSIILSVIIWLVRKFFS